MSGIKSYLIDVLAKLIVHLVNDAIFLSSSEVPNPDPNARAPQNYTPSTTPYILRMEFVNGEYITLSAVVQRAGCFLYVTYQGVSNARTSSEQVREITREVGVVPDRRMTRTYDESGTLRSQWLAQHAFDLANDMVDHRLVDIIGFATVHGTMVLFSTTRHYSEYSIPDLAATRVVLRDTRFALCVEDFVRHAPYMGPSPLALGLLDEWQQAPEYEYRPPRVTRSAVVAAKPSNVRTGHSFPFTPSHFTGAGSKMKFKNGITYDKLENTANSKKDPLVYAHTSVLGNAGGARINTGRDPTRTLAPLSSWRLVPGQRHPTLGDPQNPAARFQYGLSDLRKIPQEQLHAALAGERKRQEEERAREEESAREERARKESARELGKRKRENAENLMKKTSSM